MSYNSETKRARIFKSASRSAYLQIWNCARDYSLKCTPLGLITKHLMTDPEGNSEFCFPRNKIHCSPRDKSLSDLLYSKANGSNRWKTNNHVIDKWRATAVNISRVTVNCFLFDVIVFAMLPAPGIWRETVSLLDFMWPWTSQWMGALSVAGKTPAI